MRMSALINTLKTPGMKILVYLVYYQQVHNHDGFISPNLQRNTDDVVNTAHYSLFEGLAVVGEEEYDATLWWLQGFPSANAFWEMFHGGVRDHSVEL
jgi:hypothetical protein